jgi:hypothetical protein
MSQSLGCFHDMDGQRQLKAVGLPPGGHLTRESCAVACGYWCQKNRSPSPAIDGGSSCLAGVEGRYGNQCMCGHEISRPSEVLGAQECAVPCSGDGKETCGGDWHVDIFNVTCTGLPPAPPPTPAPAPRPPRSSTPEWRYALDCDASSMSVTSTALKSEGFDWPLDSALTITAQVLVGTV